MGTDCRPQRNHPLFTPDLVGGSVFNDWQRPIPAYPEEVDTEFFLEPIQIRKRNRVRPCSITRWIDGFFSMRELVTGMQLPG